MSTSMFLTVAALLLTSIAGESVCSIHGQSHIVMTDGRAKFSYQGEGLYQVFSTIVNERAVDVQCEFKRTSPLSTQTQLGECRVLVTSPTCKVDIRSVDGQISVWGQPVPMKNIDEFAAKSIDKSLGLAIHALANNAVGLELMFDRDFISITLAPLSLTITSASLAKCDGLCGSCSGPQTAPELDLVAAYAMAYKIDVGHAIVPQKQCGSASTFQVLQSDDAWPLPAFNAPNVSQATPVFESAAVRDAVVNQCSDGDIARMASDPLFGSFVEDCIADKSTGPQGTQTAKSSMDAFVTLIENRQKAAVADQVLKESGNATVCAACMTVEWEKPINTTGILEPSVTVRPEDIAPGTGADFPLTHSTPASSSAPISDSVPVRKNDLYATNAPLFKQPSNLYTATPAPTHNLYAAKTNEPATPLPTVGSPAPTTAGKTNQATPIPTVASPAPSTTAKTAEPTMRPTTAAPTTATPTTAAPTTAAKTNAPSTYPVVASPAPTTAAKTNAPSTFPAVASPAPTTTAKTMMPTVASPAPTTAGKSNDPVVSMTTVPTTAPSGSTASPVNQTHAPYNGTHAPSTTAPVGSSASPVSQTRAPSNGTEPTTTPSGSTASPVNQTRAPTDAPGSSAAPVNQTRAPTDAPGSSAAPVNQTRAPGGAPENQTNGTSTPIPSGSSAAPANQTRAPGNTTQAPATTAPAGSMNVPAAGTTAPATNATATLAPTSAPATTTAATGAPATAAPATTAPANTTAPTTAAPTTTTATVAPATAAPATTAAATTAPATTTTATVAPVTTAPATTAPATTTATVAPATTAPATTTATVAPATTAPATTTATAAPATTAPATTTTATVAPATTAPVTSAAPVTATQTPVATTAPNSTVAPTTASPANKTTTPTSSSVVPANSTAAPVNMTTAPANSSAAPTNQTRAPATFVPTTMVLTQAPINRTTVPATPAPTTISPTNKPMNLPPVYNCNCTISSAQLERNRDLVTYAKQTNLIPALQQAIRDGRNPELLAMIACGGATDLATILSIDQDMADSMCKVCTKSSGSPRLSYQSRPQSPLPSPVAQQTARVIPPTTARRDYNVVPRSGNTINRFNSNPSQVKGVSYVSRRRSSIAAL